jgi:hypothetical protein
VADVIFQPGDAVVLTGEAWVDDVHVEPDVPHRGDVVVIKRAIWQDRPEDAAGLFTWGDDPYEWAVWPGAYMPFAGTIIHRPKVGTGGQSNA